MGSRRATAKTVRPRGDALRGSCFVDGLRGQDEAAVNVQRVEDDNASRVVQPHFSEVQEVAAQKGWNIPEGCPGILMAYINVDIAGQRQPSVVWKYEIRWFGIIRSVASYSLRESRA